MSAEYVAEKLMDALPPGFHLDDDEPTEDMRSGGFFFEIEARGKTYEVLVIETTGGHR